MNFTIPIQASLIIDKYIKADSLLHDIYYQHCINVTELALKIAIKQNLSIDKDYVMLASMLHDIGAVKTNAPDIGCFGNLPYIAHTYLGREILEEEGLSAIAPICERHFGVGVTKEEIMENRLPLPHRDMIPYTLEDKLICYADKFYSKSGKYLHQPKPIGKVKKKVATYGSSFLQRLDELIDLFGTEYIYDTP